MQNTLSDTTTGWSYGSGFAGVVAGLSLNEWLAIMGAFFMILTYFTNLYFKRRDDIRQQKVFALKQKAYSQGKPPE